jgi:hypothetical protein
MASEKAAITETVNGVSYDYESITEEANGLVMNGDRQKAYGHPLPWAQRFAATLRAVFGWDVHERDIAPLMILFKVCRERNSHQRDNYTDVAGYAEVGNRVEEALAALARQGQVLNQPEGEGQTLDVHHSCGHPVYRYPSGKVACAISGCEFYGIQVMQ